MGVVAGKDMYYYVLGLERRSPCPQLVTVLLQFNVFEHRCGWLDRRRNKYEQRIAGSLRLLVCVCNNCRPISVCDTVLCARMLSNPGSK